MTNKKKITLISCITAILAVALIAIGFNINNNSNDIKESVPDRESSIIDKIQFVTASDYINKSIEDSAETATAKAKEKETAKKEEKASETQTNTSANSQTYFIRVNTAENFVTVYSQTKVPHEYEAIKCFLCSVGATGNTPHGTFSLHDRDEWHLMVDNSYAQYSIRIYDAIMFHSVPYFKQDPSTLETDEYNKLGTAASLGCIRLCVGDIKWIYDNCPDGTVVEIYEKKGEKPPVSIAELNKIDPRNPKAGWDPTDPRENNPWNKKDK